MLLTLHSKLAVLLLLLLLACFNCCCCGQQVLSYYINTNGYSIYLLNSVVFYVFGDAAEDQAGSMLNRRRSLVVLSVSFCFLFLLALLVLVVLFAALVFLLMVILALAPALTTPAQLPVFVLLF